jgi:phosphoglycerate dehydrogenase-like enzyme
MRLAILDDYQGFSSTFAGWNTVPQASIVAFRDHVSDARELIARLSDFDAVMRIRERTEFPRLVLESLPRLKLILATGMRNARSIDLRAAGELGIVVCTTDAFHQSTTEITWALILSLFRRLPQEIASLRAGGWQLGLGRGLDGRTLGIVGLGNMGVPVARIGQGFGMRVLAWSPNLTPERTAPYGVECVSKSELFARSDVVSVHMPLGDSTKGLIGAVEINKMKRDAYLVNTSRSQIVDEGVLLAALMEGRIAGAGLDVFDIEPLPPGHPIRTLPNVVATPHIGFVTNDNYLKFFDESLLNLIAFLNGRPIRTITATQPFISGSQLDQQMQKTSRHYP